MTRPHSMTLSVHMDETQKATCSAEEVQLLRDLLAAHESYNRPDLREFC